MTTTMCAKRGTPPTLLFVGDTDDADDDLLGDAVAVGVPAVVVVVLGVVVLGVVDAADDASVGDRAADDTTVGGAEVAGTVAVAGSWLTAGDALELRGWELVHPDIMRATAAATDHRATRALTITCGSCSEVRSARATPHRQLLRSRGQ
jgi:hypothetical protein